MYLRVCRSALCLLPALAYSSQSRSRASNPRGLSVHRYRLPFSAQPLQPCPSARTRLCSAHRVPTILLEYTLSGRFYIAFLVSLTVTSYTVGDLARLRLPNLPP